MSHAVVNVSLPHKTFLWPLASCLKGKFLTLAHRSLFRRISLTSSPFSLNSVLHLHRTTPDFSNKSYFNHLQTLARPSTPPRTLLSPCPPHAMPAVFTNSGNLPPANFLGLCLSGRCILLYVLTSFAALNLPIASLLPVCFCLQTVCSVKPRTRNTYSSLSSQKVAQHLA